MKRTLIYIFILAVISIGSVRAAVDWRLIRTGHFVVYYSGSNRSTAVRAGEIAEKFRKTLSSKLKFEPGGYIPIYLYSDRRAFAADTGVKPGETIVGMAHDKLLDIRVDASGAFEDIARIIPHEMVHIFISARLAECDFRLPRWMNEGLAKYLSDDLTDADVSLLDEAASGGQFIPLGDLADSFPTDERQRSIAYVESYSAVSYMTKTYTEASINDLLDELRKGEVFPTAMKYSIGVEPERFESDWREYMRQKYDSSRWTRFASAMVWVLMSFFAILGFRARILQKRRKVVEFEEEEAIHTDGEDEGES